MLAALALVLLLQTGPPAEATARADPAAADTMEAPGVRAGFTFAPGALYSSTAGFGIGLGYRIRNLVRPGTRLHVRGEVSQHRGRYGGAFLTADPETARAYALVALFYETTGRQWFYGLGPASGGDTRAAVRLETLEAEVRLGLRRGPLLVQPFARLLRNDVNGLDAADALAHLDPRSRAHLSYLLGEDPRQAGLEPGLGAALTFGAPERSGLVVQGGVRAYTGLNDVPDTDERRAYRTYTLGVFAFVPLPRDHTLAFRTLVQTTDRGDGVPVPFYRLPEFGGRLLPGIPRFRYFGDDLFVAAVEYRVPVLRLLAFARVDAAVSVGVGGVYDDLADEFALAVTLDEDLRADRGRYPLRPAAGVALRLVSPDGLRSRLTGVFGVSAEGWSIVTFRFVPRLTDERPLVR